MMTARPPGIGNISFWSCPVKTRSSAYVPYGPMDNAPNPHCCFFYECRPPNKDKKNIKNSFLTAFFFRVSTSLDEWPIGNHIRDTSNNVTTRSRSLPLSSPHSVSAFFFFLSRFSHSPKKNEYKKNRHIFFLLIRREGSHRNTSRRKKNKGGHASPYKNRMRPRRTVHTYTDKNR